MLAESASRVTNFVGFCNSLLPWIEALAFLPLQVTKTLLESRPPVAGYDRNFPPATVCWWSVARMCSRVVINWYLHYCCCLGPVDGLKIRSLICGSFLHMYIWLNEGGENRWTGELVTDEPVEVQSFRNISGRLKGIYRIYLKKMKKHRMGGEPVNWWASYRWTGWCSKLQETNRSALRCPF